MQTHISSRFKQHMLGLALVLGATASQAALVTATAGSSDLGLSGQATLGLTQSQSFVGLLNATNTTVSSPNLVIQAVINPRNNGYTTLALKGMPVTALAVDTSDSSLHGVQLGGSFTFTTLDDGFTNTGGSLTISKLRVDLDTKKVFGTLIGGNGVGTLDDVNVFNTSTAAYSPLSISGVIPLPGEPGYGTILPGSSVLLDGLALDFGQLALSDYGRFLWLRSLGYTGAGTIALDGASASGFGRLSTPGVPEPGTWALMGLGLVGVAAAARRRQAISSSPI
jgi:hypothetical protein